MRRIVLDQGLPATAAAILRDRGWDAVHVREIAMKEATDGEILDYAASRAWLSRWIETFLKSSR